MLKSLFGDLNAWGKLWLYIGLGTLVFAAGMAIEYGWSVSWLHAGFLAFLSLVTAFGPHAAHSVWEDGKKTASIAIVLCLPLLFVMEFQSHAAYTAGLRGQNLSETAVQNVKYDGAQEAAKEDKANLEMWKAQLATLTSQNAWAATVKADALRGKLELANKEIADETAAGGCKTKCKARMKARDDLVEQIGKVEQAEDLSKRIEATQRILDKKREVASTVEHKSSTVDHQNKFLAKVVAMTGGKLKASEIQEEGAQQFVNLSMALTATGLPALALFIAGLYRRRDTYSFTPAYPAKRQFTATPRAQPQPVVIQAPAPVYIQEPDHEARVQIDRLKGMIGNLATAFERPRTA
jgi:hypothetical protein